MDHFMVQVTYQSFILLHNQIRELAPSAFLSLGELDILSLQGNSLQAASDICNSVWQPLVNLRILNLADNTISTITSTCFHDVGSLLSLYLVKNNISELEMHCFSGLHNRQTLQLNRKRLSIIKNVSFSGLSSLSSAKLFLASDWRRNGY